MSRAAALMALTALTVFALDQLSKWWVVHALELKRLLAIELWPGLFSLRMAWNRGMNFGILSNGSDASPYILASVALLISIGVAIWVLRRGGRWAATAGGALIGGALGNAVDRLVYGAVADFLNVTCCGLFNPWAFNIADIGVFAGAIALALAPARGDCS